MAERTRNHILESESKLAFKKALPKHWVCRDKTDDYGVDLEVEIFDYKGLATGLVFWVQLKATDSDSLNVRFKKEKINQFRSYELPVLIVRYSGKHGDVYYKWANAEYSFTKSKSMNVSFTKKDIWDNKASDKILKYLIKLIRIKSGNYITPLSLFIDKAPTVKFSALYSLKEYLSYIDRYFKISLKEEDSIVYVRIYNNYVHVNIGDLAHASFSIDSNLIGKEANNMKMVLVSICSCICQLGKHELSSEIIFENKIFNVIKNNFQALNYLIPSLLSGKYFSKTLNKLQDRLDGSTESGLIQAQINTLLLGKSLKLDRKEYKAVERYFLNQLRYSDQRNTISTAYYNLASFYRNNNLYELAIHNYNKARKFHEYYFNSSYLYFEVASCLFLLDKFTFSSIFYHKALMLGSEHYITKALLADALMYSGKYEQSLYYLDQYLVEQSDKSDFNHEWYLMYSCLQTLLEHDYPSFQKRDMIKSKEAVMKGNYEEALKFDLLNNIAWFNIGVKEHNNNVKTGFLAFCFSAILIKEDIDSWVYASLLSLNEEFDPIILIYTIRSAYHYNGDRYVNLLIAKLDEIRDVDQEKILEGISLVLQEKREMPRIIRVLGEEGVTDTFTF